MAATANHAVFCITPPVQPIWLFLPALATPVLAVVALYFAWQNIRNARALGRQKATLDLIEKRESTDHYRKIVKRFSELRKLPNLVHLHDPDDDSKSDREILLSCVNHYELVAIGIRQDILDATIYRAWMEGAFVRDWNAVADWVQRERWKQSDNGQWTYRKSVFEHFQWVACSWSPDARRLNEMTSPPPDAPSGPGDEPLPRPTDEVTLKR